MILKIFMNNITTILQQICKQTPRYTIGDCAGGHRGDNREKNRDVLIVPREYHIFLWSSLNKIIIYSNIIMNSNK